MATATTQNTFCPPGITTYFNHPTKITKPNSSRNQSPRNRAGRRMTTHLPARTRSVVDPQRTSASLRQPNRSQGRPMSWHAAFVNECQAYQQFQPFPPYIEQQQQYDMYGNTIVTNGLLTPTSFPIMDGTYMDCPNIPLDHMNNQDMNATQDLFQFSNVYGNGFESIPFQQTSTSASDSMRQPIMTWPYVSNDFGHDVHTAPVSPDFLPLPDFGNPFDGTYMEEVADKDELVGMGLYDSPAEVQSASLLFGGSLLVRRKSLKLEESFEPGPLSDEDEDSDAALQDQNSVISAEDQADIVVTMPLTHMQSQFENTDQNTGMDSFQPHMMSVVSLAGMPISAHQMTPGWF